MNLLFRNAPEQEGALVHLFAGVGLLVADVGHFVDYPNFALAARQISRRLAWLRFAQALLLLGAYHWARRQRVFESTERSSGIRAR